MGATDKDWYFEDATVEAAAELTRYLMNKYGVPAWAGAVDVLEQKAGVA